MEGEILSRKIFKSHFLYILRVILLTVLPQPASEPKIPDHDRMTESAEIDKAKMAT
jgi:hypothetical protein